jgi:hypothetical protein
MNNGQLDEAVQNLVALRGLRDVLHSLSRVCSHDNCRALRIAADVAQDPTLEIRVEKVYPQYAKNIK